MRSPFGPVLVITGVATVLVLVLVLFQTIGLREDLDRLDERVAAMGEELAAQDPGVGRGELNRMLIDLESRLHDWMRENLIAFGSDAPASGAGGDTDEVLDRLDEVLDRLEALDRRLDQICEGVPIC